jgi:hypothetical protein
MAFQNPGIVDALLERNEIPVFWIGIEPSECLFALLQSALLSW